MKNGLAGEEGEGPGNKDVGFELHSEPLIPAEGESAATSKFSGDSAFSAEKALPELPTSYGINAIFLIAQEPHRLFTYWDIDISHHPGGPTYLRCFREGGTIECEIEVPFETRNWYIPVSHSGAVYFVEIGYYRGGKWNRIAQSTTSRTPISQPSPSGDFDYATIPLHLGFPELLERLQNAIRVGENLTQTLARLQKEGKFPTIDLDRLPQQDRAMLELLLGKELLRSDALNSLNLVQLREKIQQHLEKRFTSSSPATVDGTTSQNEGTEAQLLAALTSFSENSAWNTEALSNWVIATLTGWPATAIQTHPAQGTELPPQLSGKASSPILLGASEAASSWQNAENGESVEHDFFMHVNAEVVFYGSTEPGSSVTIDSKPVKVNSDGSFRFHFIFPDEAYEVPVVSNSPDGLETRAAVLRFHRTSAKSPSSQNGTITGS